LSVLAWKACRSGETRERTRTFPFEERAAQEENEKPILLSWVEPIVIFISQILFVQRQEKEGSHPMSHTDTVARRCVTL
jgi:hypothetical protein